MPPVVELPAERLLESPELERIFCALAATDESLFWLDAGAEARDGWSYLGVGDIDEEGPGGMDVSRDVAPAEVPLCGGWVGWLDYESGAERAGAPVAASSAQPRWLRVRWAVAVDHRSGAAWLVASAETRSGAVEVLSALVLPPLQPPVVSTADAGCEPDEYVRMIEACRAEIRAGNAYQLCLTTRFAVPGDHDAVSAYRRLRRATPAHHGGFLRVGDTTLLSASPELFLHAARGRVSTRPIKGTRPRGRDHQEDAALAAELVASPKERAENVMIVDLMRNDLSRVCEPGTIRVDALWRVESYPAVHQLVSTVSGELSPGITAQQLWDAAFPAGSMTGAPKLSAMTILHGLESTARGIYSGCFGYVSARGTVDLAMVIRSVVVRPEGAMVGAGGGITWGSVAREEVAEVATKAKAPLAALGATLPADWALA